MKTIEETSALWRGTAKILAVMPASTQPTTLATAKRSHAVEVRVRAAGNEHQMVTLQGGPGGYRRTPCPDCPWRKDAIGIFPPEAFVHSAPTAYDMATSMFGCHESGKVKPATCAGFLLRGAGHNLTVRIGHITGTYKHDVHDGGLPLHDNYRDMAIANGVDQDHPALEHCR
jgi:hypothetical protein